MSWPVGWWALSDIACPIGSASAAQLRFPLVAQFPPPARPHSPLSLPLSPSLLRTPVTDVLLFRCASLSPESFSSPLPSPCLCPCALCGAGRADPIPLLLFHTLCSPWMPGSACKLRKQHLQTCPTITKADGVRGVGTCQHCSLGAVGFAPRPPGTPHGWLLLFSLHAVACPIRDPRAFLKIIQ